VTRLSGGGQPRFSVRLNADVMPRLRVHDIYANALRQHKGEGSQALQQRLQEARWFIKNIQQRFDTILRVSNAIVERQKSFFVHGELAMRPLVLREIADELGLHESTISRVTTAKYMATPFGTFELKYFFGSGLGTETGGNASSTAVRALIKQFVAAESPKKPLSDNQISDMLKEQGIECARRTVAKYRDVNQLQLFLPCAAGVEELLAHEVHHLTGLKGQDLLTHRGGVLARASWRDVMGLNLHTRLAQRVLVQLAHEPYRSESDLYDAAAGVAWEIWFTPRQSFKIEITAQHSPLQSLNFAALKVKDAVADRFRHKTGVRPDVDTARPDVRIFVHLTTDHVSLYIDTSGEPLFKRGWREDKGDAPLKETLAAAMLAAAGWDGSQGADLPLYDPCCGSGTIAIEAAHGRGGLRGPSGSWRFPARRIGRRPRRPACPDHSGQP
jgi:AraC-like DNA-binding protein